MQSSLISKAMGVLLYGIFGKSRNSFHRIQDKTKSAMHTSNDACNGITFKNPTLKICRAL
jgi:hypothetical protein